MKKITCVKKHPADRSIACSQNPPKRETTPTKVKLDSVPMHTPALYNFCWFTLNHLEEKHKKTDKQTDSWTD